MSCIDEKEILTSEVVFQREYNSYFSSNILLNVSNSNINNLDLIVKKYRSKEFYINKEDIKDKKGYSRVYIYRFLKEFRLKKIIIPLNFSDIIRCKIDETIVIGLEEGSYIMKNEIFFKNNYNKEIEILLEGRAFRSLRIEIINKNDEWPNSNEIRFIKLKL